MRIVYQGKEFYATWRTYGFSWAVPVIYEYKKIPLIGIKYRKAAHKMESKYRTAIWARSALPAEIRAWLTDAVAAYVIYRNAWNEEARNADSDL